MVYNSPVFVDYDTVTMDVCLPKNSMDLYTIELYDRSLLYFLLIV